MQTDLYSFQYLYTNIWLTRMPNISEKYLFSKITPEDSMSL